ncbi:hypothetical protein OROHE_000444 [Orobanche hederae]
MCDAIKLCVFDLRRGQTEGQELDKILFFYPADLPLSTQLSVIGLSEGLITFTRIFSPEAPCEVIEAELHSHIFYEAEPDIWMVMVVENDKNPEAIWRVDALRRVLKEAHSLFVMFHGLVRALVDREPTGGLVRTHLYYFIMDFFSAFEKRSPLEYCCWDFSVGKKLQLPNFRDSLKERGTVQMLTVGREAAIEVQYRYCQPLYVCCPKINSCSSILWSWFMDLFTKRKQVCNTFAGAVLANSGPVVDQYHNSRDTSPLRNHTYPLVRPLQHSKWSKGKDGFLVTDIWGAEVNDVSPTTPTVWLRQKEKKMYLLAYQHRGLTMILLIPVSSVSGEQGIAMVKQQIIENASLKIFKVEEKLSKGWGGENAYHVSGYRYLLVDGDRHESRASPPGKVTTLAKECSRLPLVATKNEGQTEGQELDKILFFYPADLPLSTQLSVIGLSEGLITFTRIFSPEAPCEVIEAELHSHIFYEAEPDIWMVMVVENDKNPEAIWRVDALRRVLKEAHSLFVMFHGLVRALVDREPTGGLVRTHLYYFIMDFFSAFEKRSPLEYCCWDFSVGKKLQLPNFRDSLKERGTVQMLTVGREAAIEVQYRYCQPLYVCCPKINSCSSILWSWFMDLFTKRKQVCNTFAGAVLANSGPVVDQYHNSRDTSPLRNHTYPLVRPLQHSKWSKGKDGFLVTDIWGAEVNDVSPTTPTVWLRQKEKKMYLLAYQHRGLTMILLIPVSSVSGEQGIAMVKQQIIENASLKIFKVEEKLSKGWGGENAYHVSGYRYLLVDGDRHESRASPPGKVTTLAKECSRLPLVATKVPLFDASRFTSAENEEWHTLRAQTKLLESLVALSKLREEVDSEKARAKRDNPSCEKDLKVSIRAKNNAWLVARLTRGKELFMVLEKASEALLYASDAVEKFSDRYCDGAFSLD